MTSKHSIRDSSDTVSPPRGEKILSKWGILSRLGKWLRPLLSGLLGALLGLAGTLYTVHSNAQSARELERTRLTQQLIVTAAQGETEDAVRARLLLLMDLKLIDELPDIRNSTPPQSSSSKAMNTTDPATKVETRHIALEVSGDLEAVQVTIDGRLLHAANGKSEVQLALGSHALSWFVVGSPGATYQITATSDSGVNHRVSRILRETRDAGFATFTVD